VSLTLEKIGAIHARGMDSDAQIASAERWARDISQV
jgi:hypothetical protein